MLRLLFLYSLPFQVSYTSKSLKFQIRHQKTPEKNICIAAGNRLCKVVSLVCFVFTIPLNSPKGQE